MTEQAPQWAPEMAQHRRFLWRLARLQLRNDSDAEDAVQDTLLAAAQGWARYSPATPLRAWLTGILKHKIIDSLRSRQRHSACTLEALEASEPWSAVPDFDQNGRWDAATFIEHQCPQALVSRKQLMELIEICMASLPPRGAQLLLMREYLGFDTDEITAQSGLSAGNVRVVLHRARLQLRRCVVAGWGEHP
ncbi:RNA polymerase subunit sigma [Pelomonas sp. HMWF004]|nr:RNA polymerase subunit sigma [Pelomonas sp. HMWF004]